MLGHFDAISRATKLDLKQKKHYPSKFGENYSVYIYIYETKIRRACIISFGTKRACTN